MLPVAQVCLVLSVRENGPDWQLTQIGLQKFDKSRTLDRIKQRSLQKSRVLASFSDPNLHSEPIFGTSLSRTLERKKQLWAGSAAFVPYLSVF